MTPALAEATQPTLTTNQPCVTVLICTRNRGDLILATIRSVQANTYANFTLLIVDQSTDARTASVIESLPHDPHLRYISTHTRGLSIARNIGLALSHSDLVIMTDDDCEVPPDWIAQMVAPFLGHPRVGIVFCNVAAGPHDNGAGFIPISLSPRSLIIEDLARWQTCDGVNIGIGAGMAIRRSAAETVGGFDLLFGPGGPFRNGDDLDFTLRSLAANHQIARINHVSVVHHGFRTFQENRALMRGAMYSAGAAYGRLLRQGQWRAIPYFIAMFIAMVITPIPESLRRLRVPRVFGRAIWLVRGLVEGLRAPLHKPTPGVIRIVEP
jgi:glycosyltransferase involved in cell wall biosynthesis